MDAKHLELSTPEPDAEAGRVCSGESQGKPPIPTGWGKHWGSKWKSQGTTCGEPEDKTWMVWGRAGDAARHHGDGSVDKLRIAWGRAGDGAPGGPGSARSPGCRPADPRCPAGEPAENPWITGG